MFQYEDFWIITLKKSYFGEVETPYMYLSGSSPPTPPIFVGDLGMEPGAPFPGPWFFGIQSQTNWFSVITGYRF